MTLDKETHEETEIENGNSDNVYMIPGESPREKDSNDGTTNIDQFSQNADWAKRHWDLPTTLNGFRSEFLSSTQLRVKMQQLVNLPVARAMPESLIAELRAEYGDQFVPKFLDRPKSR